MQQQMSTAAICALLALCVCTTFPTAECQLGEKDPCETKTTCQECIQTQSCAWCMKPDFGDKPRCFQPSYKPRGKCPEEFIWNPDNEQTILIDRKLTPTNSLHRGRVSASDIVQFSPQRVNLKLRINQAHRLQMRYSQAKDYPIDLYYLMDLSKSMEDDKGKLSKLGDLLSDTMKNITSDFRLGFGSFVDKVLMPYASIVPQKLLHPCTNCVEPYGYRNHLSLTRDTKRFSEKVKSANVSGNMDDPEGGLDAIMQAIVCRQQIGWREKARCYLVFSTDAGFHYAGDGKLGGIIEPNDGKCHMDDNGFYTHSKILDYPSIGHINYKVTQNAINIIFAVTQSKISVYEKLSKRIQGSSSAVLSSDSSNVVELVRDEYSKTASVIEMKDNATNAVKITYHSACLTGGAPIATSKCDGLKAGDVVKFTAEIVVTACPRDPRDWNQVIQIYPVGINESLIIDLEMLCSCPCEHEGHPSFERFSPKCHNTGTYKCGICDCGDSHFGRNCECSVTDVHSKNKSDIVCRANNMTQVDCSGRGNCICRVCECEKRANLDELISGKFCECDNFSCDRHNQLLCSGPDHGTCECGICACKPGWTGSACDCRASNDTCIPPNGGEICSGNGECECGACKCKVTEESRYSGKYCEKCPTCLGRCHELKDCVQCQMYETGPLKDEQACASNCTTFTAKSVAKVSVDEDKDEYLCVLYDEDDCKFSFKYTDKEDEKLDVQAQERECPPKMFILRIVVSVIVAIVLIGLGTLLVWKLLTTIHDRREFARFEKERAMSNWNAGGNPIYLQATSTFKNPTFAEK